VLSILCDQDMAFQSNDALCVACRPFGERSFYFAKPLPEAPELRHPKQFWGKWSSRCFDKIEQNVHCPLCRLIYKSLLQNLVQNKKSSMPNGDARFYYYRMLFGTYEGEESKELPSDYMKTRAHGTDLWNFYQTSRLLVSTNPIVLGKGGPEVARGVDSRRAVGEEDDVETEILLLGAEAHSHESKIENTFLHGRETNEQFDFDLGSSWIQLCADTHGESCAPMLLNDHSPRPSRLIDIEAGMVVSATFPCSYAALSYRWTDGQLTLNEITYERLTRPGGIYDEYDNVPRTITDAMFLCHRMSIRFLWVDAVCIKQDDTVDKQNQISNMNAIYSGAHFTIVAAYKTDSKSGLPGVRSGSRPVQEREVVNGLTLAAAQVDLNSALFDVPWVNRAWTFQEAVLSRRLLIFTDWGTYFRCNKTLWCEDTHLELPVQHANTVKELVIPLAEKPFWKEDIPSEMDFEGYYELVEDYTPRSMSVQSDALNAFGGLISALEKPLRTKFFQGLPVRFFHAALSFAPSYVAEIVESRRNGFPSWSWCG
jgi:hypothetical protein